MACCYGSDYECVPLPGNRGDAATISQKGRIAMRKRARRLLERTGPIALAFAGGVLSGMTGSSLVSSHQPPGASALQWVTFGALGVAAAWGGVALRGPSRWNGWVLIGDGLLMLVASILVFGYPSMFGARAQTGPLALIAALLLLLAGAIAVLPWRPKSAEHS